MWRKRRKSAKQVPRIRESGRFVMAVQVDESAPSRDELVECLTHLAAHARKQQYVIAKFTTDMPTAWDRAHQRIDEALADLLNTQP